MLIHTHTHISKYTLSLTPEPTDLSILLTPILALTEASGGSPPTGKHTSSNALPQAHSFSGYCCFSTAAMNLPA